jgi:hypothetical protein
MYVSDVLRQQTPRKNFGANRYAVLAREQSPAPDIGRPRANSVKRKLPEGPSFAEVAQAKKTCPETNDDTVTELETEIATVNSICDKVTTDIGKSDADPAVITLFSSILEAVRGIGRIQAKIVSGMAKNKSDDFIVVGAGQKRQAAAAAVPSAPAAQQNLAASRRQSVSSAKSAPTPLHSN